MPVMGIVQLYIQRGVIFLEHGWFNEYEITRNIYNSLLEPEQGGGHFAVWGRGHFQDATPFPPVDSLHSQGNSFLCSNPICKAINRDLSEGVEATVAAQVLIQFSTLRSLPP
ncbi:unnamed protein product [Ectocarpus sp. CCAP 1310/34]|nr:unnamed protein product [Ectocarpus sp. CCAP 1310/34]